MDELTTSLVKDGDRGSTERPSYFLMDNGLADKVFVALGFLYSFGKVEVIAKVDSDSVILLEDHIARRRPRPL